MRLVRYIGFDAHDRLGVSGSCVLNSKNISILKSVLTAGLYPRVAKVNETFCCFSLWNSQERNLASLLQTCFSGDIYAKSGRRSKRNPTCVSGIHTSISCHYPPRVYQSSSGDQWLDAVPRKGTIPLSSIFRNLREGIDAQSSSFSLNCLHTKQGSFLSQSSHFTSVRACVEPPSTALWHG